MPEAAVQNEVQRSAGEAIIQAEKIEKYYAQPSENRIQVISATDLKIVPGEILALLGPSGSGKSTMLRMLTGLSRPSAGQVYWHGKPIAETEINVSIVFQSFALFPWLTVLENVEAPLQARGVAPDERRERSLRMLDTVGLDGFRSGLSQGAFGRHAAAGRLCARAGGGAGSSVHGRALLRAGRADGREPAQRTAGAVGEEDHAHQGGLHRHAQHRGGGAAGRPHHRAGAQSGPYPHRFPGADSAAARPEVAGVYRSWWTTSTRCSPSPM